MPRSKAFDRARRRLVQEFEHVELREEQKDDIAKSEGATQVTALGDYIEDIVTERGDRTGLQRLIELAEGKPLEQVLRETTTVALARKYGLDKSTVSRWKERAGWTRGEHGKLEPRGEVIDDGITGTGVV